MMQAYLSPAECIARLPVRMSERVFRQRVRALGLSLTKGAVDNIGNAKTLAILYD